VLSVAQGANEKRMKTHPFLRFADRANNPADKPAKNLGDRRSRQQQAGSLGLSYSQALAALGAACVQHGAAATGCHTGAETMRALAADNGGLVGTFHCGLAISAKIKIGCIKIRHIKIGRIKIGTSRPTPKLCFQVLRAGAMLMLLRCLRLQQKFQHRGE
jgi:hypothetical protein